jgi:hypothetical protein
MDHQETFLTSFFGFIGISDAAFVRAEGVGSGPEQRKLALACVRRAPRSAAAENGSFSFAEPRISKGPTDLKKTE